MALPEEELRELMSAQLGIWYAQQLAPGNPAYNIAEYLDIRGDLDPGLFVAALRQALDEAGTFRLRFRVEGTAPRQYVGPPREHPIHVVDVSTAADPRAAAGEWMHADLNRPVNLLDEGPLFAHALIRLGQDHHLWYQRAHHIILDGGSLATFAARVADLYNAPRGTPTGKDSAPRPVSVLMEADHAYRTSADADRDRRFWLDALADLPDTGGPARPEGRQLPGRPLLHVTDLDPAEACGLRAAARRLGTGLAGLAISAAALHHHRMTGTRDLVIGVPVNGRTTRQEFGIPGMTSNVLPIRLAIPRGTTVAQFLRGTSRALRAALPHQRYQYRDLLGDLHRVGGGSLWSLSVNVMSLDRPLRFGDCVAVRTGLSSGPAYEPKIDLYDKAGDGGLQLIVQLNPDRHDRAEGAEIARRFRTALRALAAASPTEPVDRIDVLEAEERRRVLGEWGGGVGVGPVVCVPEVFGLRVVGGRDAVAVVDGCGVVTYGELEVRADRLARYLRGVGVGRGCVVALCLPRGVEMVVAMLGVWKAGAAYLPVDVELPAERIAFMLADSR
ncbi:condensation domain-containing protein, partial [Streptomyces shenzhenensis]|uniref:condensation domain-containing protein n=1 Tax=Streptomyces shenzhenensis TaxID=943815 RepID=UPI0015EFE440